jgi:hypothetical protein
VSAPRGTVDDAEQRSDGEVESELEPGREFLPAPIVHADFAASSALAASDEQSAASLIEVGLGERERFLDAQPGSQQDGDQAAEPAAVWAVAGGAHDGDDLLDLRRIGRVAQSLVARRATRMKSGHGCWRSASAGTVEQQFGHDPSSGS